ncbi:hypothetical protein Droror1_Dr00021442 [Drosera rotundifolia]
MLCLDLHNSTCYVISSIFFSLNIDAGTAQSLVCSQLNKELMLAAGIFFSAGRDDIGSRLPWVGSCSLSEPLLFRGSETHLRIQRDSSFPDQTPFYRRATY